MSAAFKIYRIICTINGKALVSRSDGPTYTYRPPNGYPDGQHKWGWWNRGEWSRSSGGLWRTKGSVRHHLHNLCHDWSRGYGPAQYPRYTGHMVEWKQRLTENADWSRLEYLEVEEILVSDHSATKVTARDFMGIILSVPNEAEHAHD